MPKEYSETTEQQKGWTVSQALRTQWDKNNDLVEAVTELPTTW